MEHQDVLVDIVMLELGVEDVVNQLAIGVGVVVRDVFKISSIVVV